LRFEEISLTPSSEILVDWRIKDSSLESSKRRKEKELMKINK